MSVREWVEENQGKHFCQCGCGEEITILRAHHSKGIPKYRPRHHIKVNPPRYKPELHEVRQCACGCGTPVVGAKDGKLKQYAKGHWARVHNPMKRPETRAKFKGQNHFRWVPPGTRRLHCVPRGIVYWKIKRQDGYWVYDHRYVAEQVLGRKLKRSEHVHHLNGDTLDNRPENLAVISHSDHSKIHCTFPNVPRRELIEGEVVVCAK